MPGEGYGFITAQDGREFFFRRESMVGGHAVAGAGGRHAGAFFRARWRSGATCFRRGNGMIELLDRVTFDSWMCEP